MIPYSLSESAISQSSNDMQDCIEVFRIDEKSNNIGIETLPGDVKLLRDDVCADLMIMLLDRDEKITDAKRFIFYNNIGDIGSGVSLPHSIVWGCPITSYFAFFRFDCIPEDVMKVKLFLHIDKPKAIWKPLYFDYFGFIRYRLFITDDQGHLNDEPGSTVLQRKIEGHLRKNTILEIGYFIREGDHWNYHIDENGCRMDLIKYIRQWYTSFLKK